MDGVRLQEEARTLERVGFIGIAVRAAASVRTLLLAGRGECIDAETHAHHTETAAHTVLGDLVLDNDGQLAHLESDVRDLIAVLSLRVTR